MAVEVKWPVLLWVPNIIGYIRILLCIAAVLCHRGGDYTSSLFLFLANFTLDGIDGFLARKLGQTSSFGAWFDVYVDLLARGFLWVLVDGVIGYTIVSWEWLAFFAIHVGFGKKWKMPPAAPPFVTRIMANNFKTVHGFYVIGSLFLLPSWCYVMLYMDHVLPYWLTYNVQWLLMAVLTFGRGMAAVVEFWYISTFIKSLLIELA